jgi:hypothetical protein
MALAAAAAESRHQTQQFEAHVGGVVVIDARRAQIGAQFLNVGMYPCRKPSNQSQHCTYQYSRPNTTIALSGINQASLVD